VNQKTILGIVTTLVALFIQVSIYNVQAHDVIKVIVPTGQSPSWTGHHGKYFSDINATHIGVDIFGADTTKGGDAIYAFSNGTVAAICNGIRTQTCSPDFGNAIMIQHPGVGKNGTTLYSIYLHLQNPPSLAIGTTVTGGITQIGSIGNTGHSNGYYHVHFEIRYFATWLYPVWGNIYCPGYCTNDPALTNSWENPENINLLAFPMLDFSKHSCTFPANTP
jgi:murein DD-endopeptidase MepM/ murein hydrolase activator NlpD